MTSLKNLRHEMKRVANKNKAAVLQRFFKTDPGEYGEGDIFLGIAVPVSRRLAKKSSNLLFKDIHKLLTSKIHEERLIALLLLVRRFQKGSETERKKVFNFYVRHRKHINNWDLVDLSSEHVLGTYLDGKDKSLLTKLARSKSLWDRRLAMLATFHFIKKKNFLEPLKIASLLLHDEEDLIQKAVGWMLRELGKRDKSTEVEFLKRHAARMPRTMLRYAIERFPEIERKKFMSIKLKEKNQ